MSTEHLPQHIAIIPDGNRRWAKQHNLPSLEGHRRGFERIKQLVNHTNQLGIPVLTLWGFSTENWQRQEEEKGYLFKLFSTALDQLNDQIIANQTAFHHLGRQDRLPAPLLKKLHQLEQTTAHFTDKHLNIALDYGGRDEIIRAIQKLSAQGLDSSQLDEQTLSSHLDTAGQPDIDLIIRTSGEKRTSGFLPWQAIYAEFYFTDLHLPDFDATQLDIALQDYATRHRRFGK